MSSAFTPQKANGFITEEMRRDKREKELLEFSDKTVEEFMRDFASCGSEPALWLADNGVTGEYVDDVAELLQSMALTCASGHDMDMPGSDRFWRLMRRMAVDKFEFDKQS